MWDFQESSLASMHSDLEVVDQEWTRTLKVTNILPFSVVTLGLTNILNENHTELNFFEGSFNEILVRETNLYAQQKAAVKPDQNENGIFF